MVIRREYLERVKKKSFWIGVLVFPLIMTLLIGGSFMLMAVSPDQQRKIAMIDATGKLIGPMREELGEDKLKDGTPKLALEAAPAPVAGQEPSPEVLEALKQRVNKKEIFGYLVAGPNIEAEGNFKLYVKNVGSIQVTSSIERALRRAVISLRAENMKLALDPTSLKSLLAPVDMDSFQVMAGEGKAKKSNFLVSYFGTFGFVMILFMSMLLYGIAVMRGILEEKSNRIMEVLLGSLTPNELMTGKILGIALVGLTQLAVYTLTAGALRIFMMTRTVSEDMAGMADIFSMSKMVYFVLFFLLGYFMYTGMFAAVGAVCNSEQEAQNLQAPVQYMLMIPMIATFFFVNNPDSKIAVVASLIPVFTPMVMFMRISLLTPPFWQIALSIVLTLITIFFIFRGVAKIFRIGILMYGKRPTIPEIIRWARS
jgi:ABC-2 type transport system permease protein